MFLGQLTYPGSIPVVCLARKCLLVFLNGSLNVHLAALFHRFHYHHAHSPQQVVHSAPSDGIILTMSASGYYVTSGAKKTAGLHQLFALWGRSLCLVYFDIIRAWCYVPCGNYDNVYIRSVRCLTTLFDEPFQWPFGLAAMGHRVRWKYCACTRTY